MPWWDVPAQLDRIEHKLDTLLARQQTGLARQREYRMTEKVEIENLVAQIQANRDAIDSAKIALTNYVDQVAALTNQLQDAIDAGGEDVSDEIKSAADALQAQTDELKAAIPQVAEAVAANTE